MKVESIFFRSFLKNNCADAHVSLLSRNDCLVVLIFAVKYLRKGNDNKSTINKSKCRGFF